MEKDLYLIKCDNGVRGKSHSINRRLQLTYMDTPSIASVLSIYLLKSAISQFFLFISLVSKPAIRAFNSLVDSILQLSRSRYPDILLLPVPLKMKVLLRVEDSRAGSIFNY